MHCPRSTGGTIVEDDYDGEFCFDRRSIGSLQGMAPEQVIYLGTASKALAPTIGLPPGTDPENVVAHGLRRGLEFETLAEYAAEPDKPHQPAIVLAYGASPASRARANIELAVTAIEAGLAG